MNVKEAVARAKEYLADVFVDEQISNLGLEEVEFDYDDSVWLITLGFSRPWNVSGGGALSAVASLGLSGPRSYKVVCIADANGQLISIKNREPVAA